MGTFMVPPPQPPSNRPQRDPMADGNAATPCGPSSGTQVGMGGWGPWGRYGGVWRVWGGIWGFERTKGTGRYVGRWGGGIVGNEMIVSGRGLGSYGGPRGPKLEEGIWGL